MTHATVFRLLLLSCMLSILGVVAVQSFVDSTWHAPMPQRPDRASLAPQAIAKAEGPANLVHTGQRPLFLESRRPYVPPPMAAQAEPGPDPFPDVELLGLFGSGPDAGVIVKRDGKASRVLVGMHWSGWQLRSVDPVSVRAVFVSQGRADHELRLKRQPQQGGMVATLEPPSTGAEDPAEPDPGVAEADVGAADPADAAMRALQQRRAARDAALQRSRQQRTTNQ